MNTFLIAMIVFIFLFLGIILIILFLTYSQKEESTYYKEELYQKPTSDNIEDLYEEYKEKIIIEENKKAKINNVSVLITIVSLFLLFFLFISGVLILWKYQYSWHILTVKKVLFSILYLFSFISFSISLSYAIQSYSSIEPELLYMDYSKKIDKKTISKLYLRYIYEYKQNKARNSMLNIAKYSLLFGIFFLLPAGIIFLLSI